ncbi:ATP-binding protein [Roseibium aggregatum]|uniref:histidine kinase n=1 Tax=Roseibium aggregatum TaxID=187304 RepID=A0A939J2T8_9HYPH|nr:ATP-binding protein [Roseibium aggregatum]MBN9668954.1 PAS domain-containing sensor histidine kinase [Roseibium aggregatum]
MVTRTAALVSGLLAPIAVLTGVYLYRAAERPPAHTTEATTTMRMADSMRLTMKVPLLTMRGYQAYLLAIKDQDASRFQTALNFTKASLGFIFSNYIDKEQLVEQVAPLIRQNIAVMERAGLDPAEGDLRLLTANNREIYRFTEQIEKDIWITFQSGFVEFQTSETKLLFQYQIMILSAFVASLVLLAVFVRQRTLNRELIKTEAGLRESEQLLREAQSMAGIGNWDVDLKTRQVRWSEEYFRLLGYETGEVEPSREAYLAALPSEDRQATLEEVERLLTPRASGLSHFVHRVMTPDGERYLEQRGQVAFGEDNTPLRMFGTATDITERRRNQLELERYRDHLEEIVKERTHDLEKEIRDRRKIQEELYRSETRLKQILDSSTAGISILRMNPVKRIYANQCFLEFFRADSVEQLDAYGFKNTFASEEDHDKATRSVDGGTGFSRFVMERRRMDGGTWWGLHDAIPIEYEGAPAVIVWHYDITDQKLAEKELVQTEKLASLGSLVAGLAHEVNTPIGVGLTAATFLEEKIEEVSRQVTEERLTRSGLDDFLKQSNQSSRIIVSNLHRASDLVRSFKQVAVDQSSDERRTFKLVDYIEEIVLSLQPQTRKTPHAISVTGDRDIVMASFPGALSQIITNLVMNSLTHAFNDGETGEIRITARHSGPNAHIHYSDNGKGVTPEVLNRIFDPFFTTMRGSGGSGLGMHIVYNLATRKLGGTVVCDSAPGHGISVHLTVPLTAATGQGSQ